MIVFFKQTTAYELRISDWSSDVCSSELLGRAGPMSGREVARLAHDRGIAVLLVTGQSPEDAGEIALACLHKPHSPAALIGALRAIETMICKNKAPRDVAGLPTYWRPAAEIGRAPACNPVTNSQLVYRLLHGNN